MAAQTFEQIVFGIYGLAFFALGLAVAVRATSFPPSRLRTRLIALSAFGFLHAAFEWSRRAELTIGHELAPAAVFLGVAALSFLPLYVFALTGVLRSARPVVIVIAATTVTWLAAAAIARDAVVIELVTRLGVGAPAALCAAWSLARDPWLRVSGATPSWGLRVSAIALAAYALSQVVVAPADFFPASVLNTENFQAAIGVPVSAVRAGLGVLIAAALLSQLGAFEALVRRGRESDEVVTALRNSESQLARAQRLARIGSWSWDMISDEATWSDELYALFGLEKGERPATFANFLEYVPADERDDVKKRMLLSRLERRSYDIEHHVVRADGGRLLVRALGEMEFHDDGAPRHVLGIVQDITHMRETENALRQSQSQLVRAQRVARTGSWCWDLKSDEADWSDEVYAIFGFARGERPSTFEQFTESIHPNDRARFVEQRNRALKEGGAYDLEHRIVRPDGEIRFVRTQGERECDDQGRPTRVTGVIQDITQFKETTDALHQTQLTLASFLEAAPEAVIVTDDASRITVFSAGAETTFGYAAADIIGQPVGRLLPERFRRDGGGDVHAFAGSDETDDEPGALMGLRQDGSEFPAQASLSRMETPDGAFFAVILRDVSQQEAARRQLLEAKEKAEAANVAKSNFLATMSHEIRTPMNAVMGFAALLLDTPLNDKQRDYAETMSESGKHLLALINDILDLSRIEAGGLTLDNEPFLLDEIVEDVLAMMRPRARDKGVELTADVDPRLTTSFRGDAGRLRQILVNLVANAVKFTEDGSIAIAASVEDGFEDDAGVRARLSVTDTGIGIAEEDIPSLFDRFTQVDASATRRYGGAGLGLAICRQLVEAMGGEIGVESAPGEGSTFWLSLPLEHVAATSSRDRRGAARSAASASADDEDRPLRVLLAEDAEMNRTLVLAALEEEGVVIDVAVDGEEAVAAAASGVYDVIVMDVHMPGCDGMEATARIRAQEPPGVRTPIIALTADAMLGDRERCLAAGMDDYLAKPVDVDRLREKVRAWAERGASIEVDDDGEPEAKRS